MSAAELVKPGMGKIEDKIQEKCEKLQKKYLEKNVEHLNI
jgi:hypothetical protein